MTAFGFLTRQSIFADRSRGYSWVLGRLGRRNLCPRKDAVWRALIALPSRSFCEKLDGTPFKGLKVWQSRPGGMGGRVAPGAACSSAPILDAKDSA